MNTVHIRLFLPQSLRTSDSTIKTDSWPPCYLSVVVGGGEGERSLQQVPGRVEEEGWRREEVDLLEDNRPQWNYKIQPSFVMRRKWRKVKKPAAIGSRNQDTSGLSYQCSATEPQQPDNHNPLYGCQVCD